MTNKSKVAIALSVCALSLGIYFVARPAFAKIDENPKTLQTETKDKSAIDIKIEGTPITQAQPKPTVEVKQDANGNQEITPVIPKEVVPPVTPIVEPTPAPVVVPEPVKQPIAAPVEKPVKTPVKQPAPVKQPEAVKTPTQTAPVAKPQPTEPEFGASRVVNGQEQTYFPGQGWVTDEPGGESEYAEGMGTGDIVGQ